MAAMEEYEGAAHRLLRRGPMSIKQFDAIVRAKGRLDHRTFRRQRCGDDIVHRTTSLASTSARCTRFITVTTMSAAKSGSAIASQSGSFPPRPTHNPSAPTANDR